MSDGSILAVSKRSPVRIDIVRFAFYTAKTHRRPDAMPVLKQSRRCVVYARGQPVRI
jgi:hypothetical protein